MSRYYDDGDGFDSPQEAALWEANYERALKGKKGRRFLADLKAALLALPEPKLIEGALCTVGAGQRADELGKRGTNSLQEKVQEQGEGVCAIGAYLWYRKVAAGIDPAEAFTALPTLLDEDADLWETANLAVAAGVVTSVAWRTAYRNDETYGDMTPEERHAAFIAWIDEQLAVSA